MQLIRRPYEILVRWLPSGELSGAHVGYLTVAADDQGFPLLNEDGTYTLLKSEPVQPIDHAGPDMAAILGDITVQAKAEATALALDKAALEAQLATARADLRKAQDALQGAQGTIAALQAQIDAEKAPGGSQGAPQGPAEASEVPAAQ